MTPIWGVTDGGRKTTGRDRTVLPATVVYDPALTTSLPTDISAVSGMNGLAHLVEGLYAPDASPVTAVLAEEGIRALADALPRVVVAPGDLDARACALYGAWLAGWVLGTAGMGLHHKICHVLGGPTTCRTLGPIPRCSRSSPPTTLLRRRRRWSAQLVRSARRIRPVRYGSWLSGSGRRRRSRRSAWIPGRIPEAARLVVETSPVNPRPVDRAAVDELLRAAYAGRLPGA